MTWLIPSGTAFTPARFCRACAPTGTLIDIECHHCGDGPLILLDQHTLPSMPIDPNTRDRALAYLHHTGWQIDTGDEMTCPRCADRANPP